jgi:hypothetical protein
MRSIHIIPEQGERGAIVWRAWPRIGGMYQDAIGGSFADYQAAIEQALAWRAGEWAGAQVWLDSGADLMGRALRKNTETPFGRIV